ncbi:UNVERIFIED_CONTAM: Transcriptional regulator STERILE APETALA [Sesamum angustifolium]|uniref:Transcriptional regulator STERILE APETALA n=1 Tax=Sesamum angustifolium TaxID=2727405 RepID=A0AAW2J1T9_9LAMI
MSTSSSEEVEGGDGGGGGGGGEFEGPSSRRRMMRSSNGVWPAPFVEALAFQVAADASLIVGRLAAAQALFNVFQVCSTWRAVSRSELLWQNLTRRIWNVGHLAHNTWREEYIYRHRTASNFRSRRCVYSNIHIPIDHNNNNNDGLSCRRLALSDHHLAAGFSDGAVHLFHLLSRLHLSTFYPHYRDRIGRFSSSVSGIILSDVCLVFATLDGDIHSTVIDVGITPLRRAHMGDVVNDGVLVDFTGSNQWWVGLYAGVPGRAFHIWNIETEELVFIGGTLTDPEAVIGWHLLTEMTDLIGRVRVTSHENAVACTSLRVIVFDLANQIVLGEQDFRRGITVASFDANNESTLITDSRGTASMRRVVDLEEICRFTIRGASQQRGRILGCVNGGYGVVFGGGVIRVWEIEHGGYLYSFRERIGECNALAADDSYVAACSPHGILHLWDFRAQ